MERVSLAAMLRAALLWAAQARAVTFPTALEVDLIFPRNETYAPSRLFPIVFAFQNAELAQSIDPHLSFGIWDTTAGPDTRNWTLDGHPLNMERFNFMGADTVYVYTYMDNFDTTRGLPATTHSLTWELSAKNCSNEDGNLHTFGGWWSGYGVEFTIRNDSQQSSDFVAAMGSNERCADRSYVAFNVTGTLPEGNHSCAVFSDVRHTPLVAGKPCAVQASPAAASSIMANITSWGCETNLTGVIGCPLSSLAGLGNLDSGYMAVLGGLVAALVGITLQAL